MISVCVATFNGEPFVRQQLESILRQLSPQDEVIVSDDGSTDRTLSVIRSIGDPRIRIVEGPGAKSPTLNFENALREASGDYIFMADQDDAWTDDKVTESLKWLQDNDCVVSDAYMTDERLNIVEKSFFKINHTRRGRLYNLLVKNGYMGCCMAFTREVLDASLPFPPDVPMHDIWIGNVAAFKFRLAFIDKPLVFFRRHEGNTSFTSRAKSGYPLRRKLAFRWNTLRRLLSII